MKRFPIRTDKAPAAIGPYSQAILAGGFLFTAGQIPLSPETGEVVGGNVAGQTERVILNLKAVLEAGGSGISRVVKTTVYLSDINTFSEMNDVYGRFFPDPGPARSCAEVSALPKSVAVMIEAIAAAESE